jgi:hypothetical protein
MAVVPLPTALGLVLKGDMQRDGSYPNGKECQATIHNRLAGGIRREAEWKVWNRSAEK